MSTTTTNFNIVLPEGTDTFNPLTFNNNAFTLVDSILKANQDRGITMATHIYLDGINTIVRTVGSCNFLVFIATADYVAGSTISVDGVTMTFRTSDGAAPTSNAFRINQAVLCYVNGNILTLMSASSAEDIDAINNKIGDVDISKIGDSITGAIDALNQNITSKADKVWEQISSIGNYNRAYKNGNVVLVTLYGAKLSEFKSLMSNCPTPKYNRVEGLMSINKSQSTFFGYIWYNGNWTADVMTSYGTQIAISDDTYLITGQFWYIINA